MSLVMHALNAHSWMQHTWASAAADLAAQRHSCKQLFTTPSTTHSAGGLNRHRANDTCPEGCRYDFSTVKDQAAKALQADIRSQLTNVSLTIQYLRTISSRGMPATSFAFHQKSYYPLGACALGKKPASPAFLGVSGGGSRGLRSFASGDDSSPSGLGQGVHFDARPKAVQAVQGTYRLKLHKSGSEGPGSIPAGTHG